jgi:hypothetical protein
MKLGYLLTEKSVFFVVYGSCQGQESCNLTAEYGLARGLPVGEHAPQPLCLLLGLLDPHKRLASYSFHTRATTT